MTEQWTGSFGHVGVLSMYKEETGDTECQEEMLTIIKEAQYNGVSEDFYHDIKKPFGFGDEDMMDTWLHGAGDFSQSFHTQLHPYSYILPVGMNDDPDHTADGLELGCQEVLGVSHSAASSIVTDDRDEMAMKELLNIAVNDKCNTAAEDFEGIQAADMCSLLEQFEAHVDDGDENTADTTADVTVDVKPDITVNNEVSVDDKTKVTASNEVATDYETKMTQVVEYNVRQAAAKEEGDPSDAVKLLDAKAVTPSLNAEVSSITAAQVENSGVEPGVNQDGKPAQMRSADEIRLMGKTKYPHLKTIIKKDRTPTSSPVCTPPSTPPPEIIEKIKSSSRRKSTIMLPMGMPSKRGRGHAISTPVHCTTPKMQRIIKRNLGTPSLIPGAPVDNSAGNQNNNEIFFDHDYCFIPSSRLFSKYHPDSSNDGCSNTSCEVDSVSFDDERKGNVDVETVPKPAPIETRTRSSGVEEPSDAGNKKMEISVPPAGDKDNVRKALEEKAPTNAQNKPPVTDMEEIGVSAQEMEDFENSENNDISNHLCKNWNVAKEHRNYRKKDASQVDDGAFDKIPSYYTALSRPPKSTKTDILSGSSCIEAHAVRELSPERLQPNDYSKLPAYFSCFTNSTKYDSDNWKACSSSKAEKDGEGDFDGNAYLSDDCASPGVRSYRSRSPSWSYSRSRCVSSRSRSRSRSSSRSTYSSRSRSRSRSRSWSPRHSNSRARSRRGHKTRRASDSRSSLKRGLSIESQSRSRSRSRAESRSRVNRKRYNRNKYRRRYSSRSRSRSRSYSRSRSRSFSKFRSRSRSTSSERYRSRQSRRRCRSRSYEGSDIRDRMKAQQIEERRIIYVGNIPPDYSKRDLERRFGRFGEIDEVSVHFREHGDNYGFVTFSYTCDAYAAIENGNKIIGEPKVDLCFGGRRQFCKTDYADLDGNVEIEEEYNIRPTSSKQDVDFDTLLQMAKQKLKR